MNDCLVKADDEGNVMVDILNHWHFCTSHHRDIMSEHGHPSVAIVDAFTEQFERNGINKSNWMAFAIVRKA